MSVLRTNYPIYITTVLSKLTGTHEKWHLNIGLESTHASSMLGWKILFMNPKKAKVEMIFLFIFFESGTQKMWSLIPPCDGRTPTYWWWFERVFVRKIYSHLPHTSLVRSCTRGHKKIMSKQSWFHSFLSIEHCIPSFTHSAPPSQKHNRARATWETSYTFHFSPCQFLLFYAVMYFSPRRILSFQIALYHTLTSKRKRMRLCESSCV